MKTSSSDKIKIRKATAEDSPVINSIFENARRFMRANGNLNQWIGGYPGLKEIEEDLKNGQLFVGCNEENEIEVAFTFILGEDYTYKVIEEGEWLNDEPYGTIHRIASAGKNKRMLDVAVDFCFGLTDNIRIDTHKDNFPMQNALKRLGFHKCGRIYCRDGSPRVAFQKTKTINI